MQVYGKGSIEISLNYLSSAMFDIRNRLGRLEILYEGLEKELETLSV